MIQEPDSAVEAEPFENIVRLNTAQNQLKEVCKMLKVKYYEGN